MEQGQGWETFSVTPGSLGTTPSVWSYSQSWLGPLAFCPSAGLTCHSLPACLLARLWGPNMDSPFSWLQGGGSSERIYDRCCT